jgi:hypothetical protein
VNAAKADIISADSEIEGFQFGFFSVFNFSVENDCKELYVDFDN